MQGIAHKEDQVEEPATDVDRRAISSEIALKLIVEVEETEAAESVEKRAILLEIALRVEEVEETVINVERRAILPGIVHQQTKEVSVCTASSSFSWI